MRSAGGPRHAAPSTPSQFPWGRNSAALSAALLIALAPSVASWATATEGTNGAGSGQGEGSGGTGDGSGAGQGEGSGEAAGSGTGQGDGSGGTGDGSGVAQGDAPGGTGDGSGGYQGDGSGATSTGDGNGTGNGDGNGSGGGSTGGLGYGGRAVGPDPLPLLADDPAYPVPAPPVNDNLPEAVDVQPGRQLNIVCDPVDRPGVEAFARLITRTYHRSAHSTFRECIDQKSEHYDGRALDWDLNAYDPHDRRIGDAVAMWLTDNDGEMALRFGIQSIIWNAHSWNATDPVWKAYVGQSAHTDHIHLSFTWDGANMRTSWWTGIAVEQPDLGPCPAVVGAYAATPQAPRYEACTGVQVAPSIDTGYVRVRPGQTGGGVGLLQPLLDVPQTGVLDEPTRTALIDWQSEQGVPATGVLDQLTYAAALGWQLPELPEEALAVEVPDFATTEFTPYKRHTLVEGDSGEAVAVLQEALGIEADGVFGPKTAEALAEFITSHPVLTDQALVESGELEPLPADEVRVTPLVWSLLELREYPTLTHRYETVEVGDENRELVALLQEHLGVEADGVFGPVTEQAVMAEQAAAELEPTGVVDGPTWAAIDKGRGLNEFQEGLTQQAEQAEQASDEQAGDEQADDVDEELPER